MSKDFRPSGRVSFLALPVVIFAVAACGAAGAVYRAAIVKNPYGIANPLLTIIAAFVLGFIVVWAIRLGKIRHRGVSFIAGMLALLAFQIAGLFVIRAMLFPTAYLGDALQQRWSNGVPMLASKWSIRGGGWKWSAIILEWLLFFCAAWFTSAVEAARPFCESCVTWARKGRWKCKIMNPAESVVTMLKANKNLAAALNVTGGGAAVARRGPESGRLEYSVGACRCGTMATLDVKFIPRKNNEDGVSDDIITDFVLTPRMLERVLDWGERINPALAGQRPMLSVGPKSTEPLGRAAAPDDKEYTSLFRWSGGSIGASDFYADNEYTKAVRARLDLGHYQIAEEAMRAQRHADDLACVVEACAEWRERPAWFEDWEYEAPDSPALALIRGVWTAKAAWRARGTDWTPKNFHAFQALMQQADHDLMTAAELTPRDPTPWAWRIVCSFAMQRGVDEVQGILNEVKARAPRHRMAHSWMMKYLMSKWFGSTEKMFEFARAASFGSPAGSNLSVLIAEAHLERSYQQPNYKDRKAAEAYWADPAVGAELLKAHKHGPGSERFQSTMDTPRLRAMFAYTLWRAGQREAAAEHLSHIGTTTPWGPFAPTVLFMSKHSVKRARRECRV